VVVLLSSKFMILVGISNLVAWPVAYWVMTRWLSDFAYRVTLGPGLFLLAGGGAALLALATVSAQAIRASTANPVEALRYE
jgi:putative ABC transport system permease protein